MKNKIFRHSIVVFAVFMFLATIFSSTSTFADDQQVVVRDAYEILEKISTAEAATGAFRRCLDGAPGDPHKGVEAKGSKGGGDGGHMLAGRLDTQYSVGPWIEQSATGDDADKLDGELKCDEKNDDLARIFAESISLDKLDIFCNKNDEHNSPGLVASRGGDTWNIRNCKNYAEGNWEGGYFWIGNFGNPDSTPKPYYYPSDYVAGTEYWEGTDYVAKVYNEWIKNNNYSQYTPEYKDVGNRWPYDGFGMTKYAAYYMMLRDFYTICVAEEIDEYGAGISNRSVSFPQIERNGAKVTKYYEVNGKFTRDKVQLIWDDADAQNDCWSLAGHLNDWAGDYRTKLGEIYKGECDGSDTVKEAWNFAHRKADYIINGDPTEPVIITPNYLISPEKLKFTEDGGSLSKEEYDAWQNKGLVWENYTTTVDNNGNNVYTVVEIPDADKDTAKKVLEEYDKYQKAGTYFEDLGESEGFTCHVPEGFSYTEVSSGSTTADCYSAGIDSMSWILCPTLNNAATTADGLTEIINDWLEIKSDEVFKDNIKSGWETFRNVANVILIIFFLAVIFSQLTGVGIDNYGIKKMLPKLIIMAILINFSYIICQIAVDISNILGVGLNNLMKGVGFQINGGNDPAAGFGFHHIMAILFGLMAGAGGVAAIGVGSGGGIMLVISLLLAVFVALIAVLIFFMMLSARMVIVVIFSIISPIAFACYILPNTQFLFKKWWEIFRAALVVFPLCGLLYGASYIIKAILIDPKDLASGILAVVAPFLPFLILPSLLKGALSALGAIGGTIATLGNGLKKGVTSGAQAAKRSERLQDANTRWMAGYKSDGTKKNLRGFGRFIRGGKRSVQSNALKYQKAESERGARKATEGEDFMLATETANETKRIVASGEINDSGRLKTGLQLALEKKNRAAIRAYTDALSGKGESGRQIVGEVWNNYAADKEKVSAVSAKTFADNIMANHSADYKANDRAMFNVAQAINKVEGRKKDSNGNYTETEESYGAKIKQAIQTREGYVAGNKGELYKSVSANSLGAMDDEAFKELFGEDGSLTEVIDDKNLLNNLGKEAYEAIHGANAANIKAERMKALRGLVEKSEYRPEVLNVRIQDDDNKPGPNQQNSSNGANS